LVVVAEIAALEPIHHLILLHQHVVARAEVLVALVAVVLTVVLAALVIHHLRPPAKVTLAVMAAVIHIAVVSFKV
jgi:hypothetical protein